ncbi:MAG: SMP-30/gluconolactonase/LRE family protein [Actinomycetota bacterium]
MNEEVPGDLVAVNPDTGEERVLVEDLDDVYSASWSADGRWVAYETDAADGGWRDLWVAGEAEEPQLVATGGDPGLFADIGLYWTWSPTGAELATIGRSKLTTIDLSTGETTHLGKVTADLLETNQPPTWAWSPDGTRLVFAAPEGAPDGSLYTVDVRTGERSLLARLPDDRDLTEKVVWSPDGTRIAVLIRKASNEAGRLYVMDADGSDIQVMADDYDPLGIAWSPDGTRLAFGDGSPPDPMARIRIVPMDGGAPAEIELTLAGCEFNYMCRLTWSPDGSRLAFHNSFAWVAVDADGRGEAEPIDELTYLSWEGGSYPWEP